MSNDEQIVKALQALGLTATDIERAMIALGDLVDSGALRACVKASHEATRRRFEALFMALPA